MFGGANRLGRLYCRAGCFDSRMFVARRFRTTEGGRADLSLHRGSCVAHCNAELDLFWLAVRPHRPQAGDLGRHVARFDHVLSAVFVARSSHATWQHRLSDRNLHHFHPPAREERTREYFGGPCECVPGPKITAGRTKTASANAARTASSPSALLDVAG